MTEHQIAVADKLHELANLVEAGEIEVTEIESKPHYERIDFPERYDLHKIGTTLSFSYVDVPAPKKTQQEMFEHVRGEKLEQLNSRNPHFANCSEHVIKANIFACENTTKAWRKQWEK